MDLRKWWAKWQWWILAVLGAVVLGILVFYELMLTRLRIAFAAKPINNPPPPDFIWQPKMVPLPVYLIRKDEYPWWVIGIMQYFYTPTTTLRYGWDSNHQTIGPEELGYAISESPLWQQFDTTVRNSILFDPLLWLQNHPDYWNQYPDYWRLTKILLS